jgi:glyoxylase-like metal-dependent hydrolase (beta-lactamase superfamily II)
MARLGDRNAAGAPGDWFVDTRCIDCDASRQMAPDLLERVDGLTVFRRQPETDEEIAAAWRAALVCPTQSIGNLAQRRPPPGVFPHHEGDGVLRCGFNARSSFGAHSYLVVRPEGNLLVDGPRWAHELVDAFTEAGGLSEILLTHRDDIGDARRYAEHFAARVWIHELDAAVAPFATDLLRGSEVTTIRPGLDVIPVPGHTRGSVVYRVDDDLLFTGDSLAWNPATGRLTAFRHVAWFSWDEQLRSLARLAATTHFRRIFAGHGWSHSGDPDALHDDLQALVARG